MKNIYLTTIGRLGNQMFQYAALRALCIEIHANPVFVRGDEEYALGCFELNNRICHADQPKKTFLNRLGIRLYDHFVNIWLSPKDRNRQENKWFLPLQILGLYYYRNGVRRPYKWLLRNRNVLCYGYFQSAEYFDNYRDVITQDFTFSDMIKSKCEQLARRIAQEESVCVHVRRGDYLTLPEFQVCTEQYFIDAMAYIQEEKPNAKFFMFTDDEEYCKKVFEKYDIFIIPNNYSGSESMYLGTLCKNHIMSNSSFSWWMQYLAYTPQQIVIAPKKWYHSTYIADGIYQNHWRLM